MIEKNNFKTFIDNTETLNINNKYDNLYNSINNELKNISNYIFYGPPGCGKYSECLKFIRKYSTSQLKYEKKMIIDSHKNNHILKISDIHYEINMENLTCNSKLLFNDIYTNIIDSIESSEKKEGIILCKNFHLIDNELLEIFYSYMQKIINNNIIIRFFLITEHLCLIPKNVLDICNIFYYCKFSISNYIKLSNTKNKKFISKLDDKDKKDIINNLNNINILKNIDLDEQNYKNLLNLNKVFCDIIVDIIVFNDLDYVKIRNSLYNLLTYNLNLYECIYYILENVIIKCKEIEDSQNNESNNKKLINDNFLNLMFIKTCEFLKYYNNNYRPIYHLESYILYIISIIHHNED